MSVFDLIECLLALCHPRVGIEQALLAGTKIAEADRHLTHGKSPLRKEPRKRLTAPASQLAI